MSKFEVVDSLQFTSSSTGGVCFIANRFPTDQGDKDQCVKAGREVAGEPVALGNANDSLTLCTLPLNQITPYLTLCLPQNSQYCTKGNHAST